MEDLYTTLGINKGATESEIKKAYRKKAQEFHPDKNPDNKDAEKKFKAVQEAYETISDPQKRANYDRFGSTGSSQSGPQGGGFGFNGAQGGFNPNDFGGFADIFESFFGENMGGRQEQPQKAGPMRGNDIQVQVDIKFEEAIFGTDKYLEISKPETCQKCTGKGNEPGTAIKKCGQCNGQGQVRVTRQTILGKMSSVHLCPSCQGTGEIPEKLCSECRGQMRTKQTEEVTVKIPKGIEDGTSIKIKEKGSAGIRGGKHGDLYVHVRVFAHKNFLRDGANIHSEENIHVLQAILGANVKVETVHGKVDLKIPAGIQSGTELSIKGKGAPSIRSDKMGDHILRVNVKIPEKLNKKERELFEALAKESKVNVKAEGFFDGIF